jgi:hypothetical protein
MNVTFGNPRAAKALSLYRQILRHSKTWNGPEHEKEYIVTEARKLFHKNRDETDSQIIDAKAS